MIEDDIAWSYELLDADEKRLFRRAAVLLGSWTLQAAEAVCNHDGAAGQSIAGGLGALVDQAMLVREDWRGDMRLKMLETLRQFGLAQLKRAQEEEATRNAHAGYYAALVQAGQPVDNAEERARWREALSWENDNLRAALAWCLAAEERGALGLRLAASLARYWELSGALAEGRRWLEEALVVATNAPAEQRAAAHHGAAGLAYQQGDHEGAAIHYEAALACWQRVHQRSRANRFHNL